jgi:hypothetical protein
MLRMLLVCAAAVLAALVAASAAESAPPVIVSAGATNGHATATWTLPPAVISVSVEVATASAVDSDGYFLSQNVVDSAIVGDNDTSWTGSVALQSGTYYVHVSGDDTSCSSCSVEWTAIRSFTIGSGGSTPTSTTTTTDSTTTTRSTTTTTTTTGSTTTITQPATTTTTPGGTTTTPPLPVGGVQVRRTHLDDVELVRSGRTVQGVVRACAPAAGRLDLSVIARRGRAATKARRHLAAAADGCWPYVVSFRLPPGAGRATVSLRVRDARSAWSAAITRSLR